MRAHEVSRLFAMQGHEINAYCSCQGSAHGRQRPTRAISAHCDTDHRAYYLCLSCRNTWNLKDETST